MTNEELADICDEAVSDMEDSHSPYLTRIRNGLLEAAQRFRDMPEGERIEGIIIEETRNRTLLFEQRDPDMAVPVAYARATLTIHERKEGESR